MGFDIYGKNYKGLSSLLWSKIKNSAKLAVWKTSVVRCSLKKTFNMWLCVILRNSLEIFFATKGWRAMCPRDLHLCPNRHIFGSTDVTVSHQHHCSFNY